MYLCALECFQFSWDLHLWVSDQWLISQERLGAWGGEDDGERTSGSNKMLRVHGGYKKSYDFFFPLYWVMSFQEFLCKGHLDINKTLQYWLWRREGEEPMRNAIYHLWKHL